MRSVLDLSGMSSQALGICDMSERQILRIEKVLFDFAIE